MRLVLDTNTALSGLLWLGLPGKLIDAAQNGQIELATSTALLAELQDVIGRAKFSKQVAARGISAAELFEGYAALSILVTPAIITPTIVTDPPDDLVLGTALAAQADLIVTRDGKLRNLKSFHRIPIVHATEALHRIQQKQSS